MTIEDYVAEVDKKLEELCSTSGKLIQLKTLVLLGTPIEEAEAEVFGDE